MPDEPRRVEYMRLDEILPAERNPKKHDDDGIVGSLDRFGSIDAMSLDDRTGRLVAGHGRLEGYSALLDAGAEPPEGLLVDDDGMWRAPVLRGWASSNDLEAEAAGVALNKLTIAGGFDDRQLAQVLADVAAQFGEGDDALAAALAGTGFSQDEYERLLASVAPPTPPPEFPDAEVLAGNTQHRCPKCGYEWSGSPTPGVPVPGA